MKRIAELDGLRAIAILVVLGCHYKGFAILFDGLPEFGWAGVELFFVLSGYLITTILLGLRDKPNPYRTFYARRIIRIWPPYIATVCGLVLIEVARRQDWVLSPIFLLKQLLFLQAGSTGFGHFFASLYSHPHFPALLASAHHLPWGTPGPKANASFAIDTYWSLSVEEYFYLLWAPIVLRCSPRAICAIGIGVCIIESLLRWSYGSHSAYFGLPFRFDALMYGAFLALFLSSKRKQVTGGTFALFAFIFAASIIAIVTILWIIHPVIGREIRDSPMVLAIGLPLLSLCFASLTGMFLLRAQSSWGPARLMRTFPMQFVGRISYTMYLVHILAAAVVVHVWSDTVPQQMGTALFSKAVISSALTILIAQLSWRFLEKPLLDRKEHWFPRSKGDRKLPQVMEPEAIPS